MPNIQKYLTSGQRREMPETPRNLGGGVALPS